MLPCITEHNRALKNDQTRALEIFKFDSHHPILGDAKDDLKW